MINEKDEKFLKEKINKYMSGIKIPGNLEGIIMEDINKVKNEQKKKMSKTKKILAGAASFVVIAGAVSAFAFKDVLFNKNGVSTETPTTGISNETPMAKPEDENKISLGDFYINIEDKNLYAVGFGDMAFIQNGEVYYGYQYTHGSGDISIKFKKVEGITDAVSVGAYSLSTDVSKSMIVITEEGTLYTIDVEAKAHKFLEKYKVAQIVSAQGEENHEYVLVLKDNRKIKINTGIYGNSETTVEEQGVYENINIAGNKGNKLDGDSLYVEGFDNSSFIVNGNVYIATIQTENSGDKTIKVVKQDNISNAKSIKGFSISTDPSTTFMAITESGEVYGFYDNEVELVEYMKEYKVTDIKLMNVSEAENVACFELTLKNGEKAIVYSERFRNVSGSIVSKDFIGTWESSEEDMTELKIYEDGTFLMDHYTVSSEVKGTYTISDANIEFTNQNGEKWTGEMLAENGVDHLVINAMVEGKEMYLWYVPTQNN